MKRYLIALIVLLGGCASDPYWVKTVEFTPTEIIIQTTGGFSGGFVNADNVEGFAVRDMPAGACTIFVRVNISNRDAVIAHETKHCYGWDHPGYRVNLSGIKQGYF